MKNPELVFHRIFVIIIIVAIVALGYICIKNSNEIDRKVSQYFEQIGG